MSHVPADFTPSAPPKTGGRAEVLPPLRRGRKCVSSSTFPDARKLLDCAFCWVKTALSRSAHKCLSLPVKKTTKGLPQATSHYAQGSSRSGTTGNLLEPTRRPLGRTSSPGARAPPCHQLSRMEAAEDERGGHTRSGDPSQVRDYSSREETESTVHLAHEPAHAKRRRREANTRTRRLSPESPSALQGKP